MDIFVYQCSANIQSMYWDYSMRREKKWQESRAVARKTLDAAAVLLGLKFADNIHYKFKSSQDSKAKLFIEYPLNFASGCISMFSINLTFDKTLMMQFCYFSCKIATFWTVNV